MLALGGRQWYVRSLRGHCWALSSWISISRFPTFPFGGRVWSRWLNSNCRGYLNPFQSGVKTGEQCGDKVDYTCGCPGQSWDRAGVSILVLLDFCQFLIPLTTVFGYGVGRARWSDPYSVVGLSQCGQEGKRMCPWTLTCGDPQGSMLSPLLST